MFNNSKCYFCNKTIDDLITFQLNKINSKLINLSKSDFSFWVPSLDAKSCKECGLKYRSWTQANNKVSLIINREISGKLNIKFPQNIVDTCDSCNKIFTVINKIEEKKYKFNNNKYCEYCWNQYLCSFR